jgi:hypothetical protein
MLHSLSTEAKLFYCIYYSLLELLGDDQVDYIFASADLDPFDQTAPHYFRRGIELLDSVALQLSTNFGEETTRGLLIRMGSASLTFFRKYFSEIAQLGSIENRLKPLDRRFLSSLNSLAAVLSKEMGTEIKVDFKDTTHFEWRNVKPNKDPDSEVFAPYFYFGLLEEFCNWLDARKNYLLNYAPDENNHEIDLITIEVRNME